MSERRQSVAKRSLYSQTPHRHDPLTPLATSNNHLRHLRSLSARSAQHATTAKPTSARGILRRLAKITAPTTKRRTITPKSVGNEKENKSPKSVGDFDDDRKKSIFALNFEATIGEEDSELLVPPTPSALFQQSDDEIDPEPTLTFLQERAHLNYKEDDRAQTIPVLQSDSAIYEERDTETGDGDSTFLTEKGRRAISEEPTRMSRYSFGTIRMSDFGSELEIRRESDRQQKLAELEAQDDYDFVLDDNEDNVLPMGGETENLRDLQRRSSLSSEANSETTNIPTVADNTFHFDVTQGSDIDRNERLVAGAHQNVVSAAGPVPADSILEIDHDAGEGNENDTEGPTSQSKSINRRQTLLESVLAAAKPRSRKALKMNRKGNVVPSLPSSLIRWVANESQQKAGKRKIKLGKDHMKALEQATEWFFEQVGEDLEAYSSHGKRRSRISTDDVLLLMRRQRVLRRRGEFQELAQNWLPKETLKNFDFSAMS